MVCVLVVIIVYVNLNLVPISLKFNRIIFEPNLGDTKD